MKKILPTLALFIPFIVFAAEGDTVQLMTNLPIIGNSSDLAGFLQGMFRLTLGIAVIAAVVIIVINGIRYMVSDVAGKKEDAKSWIQEVIWGLILAFASVLILSTINPQLTRFDFITTLQEIGEDVTPGGGGGTVPPQPPAGGCSGCVPLVATTPPPFNITASCGSQCTINPGTLTKLDVFNGNLAQQNITWRITEAYPPSVTHQNQCHQNGTCIDANMSSGASGSSIAVFAQSASHSGLTACYEVKTQERKNELVTDGAPASNVSVVTAITGEHFSVYGYSTACR